MVWPGNAWRQGRAVWTVLIVVALLAAALVGCSEDDIERVEGSGNVIVDERAVDGFDEIALRGAGDVVVELGPEERLTVEADDNLLEYLLTDVRGDRLELRIRNNTSISPSEAITYRVTATDLDKVAVFGSGDLVATEIATDKFEASINGSGTITLAGMANEVEFAIPGSGRIDGTELVAFDGDVIINGSGTIIVHATDRLDVAINGSGNVEYFGDPDGDRQINGSGNISRVE